MSKDYLKEEYAILNAPWQENFGGYHVTDCNDKEVCSVYLPRNGKLIAALPEMLYLLEEAQEEIFLSGVETYHLNEVVKKIDELLKRILPEQGEHDES